MKPINELSLNTPNGSRLEKLILARDLIIQQNEMLDKHGLYWNVDLKPYIEILLLKFITENNLITEQWIDNLYDSQTNEVVTDTNEEIIKKLNQEIENI